MSEFTRIDYQKVWDELGEEQKKEMEKMTASRGMPRTVGGLSIMMDAAERARKMKAATYAKAYGAGPKTIASMGGTVTGRVGGGPKTGYVFNSWEEEELTDILKEEMIDKKIDVILDGVLAAASIGELFEEDEVIEWVKGSNIKCDDVFDDTEMIEYVGSKYTVNEVFTTSDIRCEVSYAFKVNDIYCDKDILEYVRDNLMDEVIEMMREEGEDD